MHNQNPTSERCLHLAELLIREHVLLIPNPVEALKNIPEIAPIFAATLTTATTGNLTSFIKIGCRLGYQVTNSWSGGHEIESRLDCVSLLMSYSTEAGF